MAAVTVNVPPARTCAGLPDETSARYRKVYDQIKASGFDGSRPIELDEHGGIRDGHHRYRAAVALGIDPPTVTRPTGEPRQCYCLTHRIACEAT